VHFFSLLDFFFYIDTPDTSEAAKELAAKKLEEQKAKEAAAAKAKEEAAAAKAKEAAAKAKADAETKAKTDDLHTKKERAAAEKTKKALEAKQKKIAKEAGVDLPGKFVCVSVYFFNYKHSTRPLTKRSHEKGQKRKTSWKGRGKLVKSVWCCSR